MTNFQIFDTVLGLSRMPRQVEFDKPITFEDAHNRLFPLNIQWLDTWEVSTKTCKLFVWSWLMSECMDRGYVDTCL